jgi:alkylglycerol monooxygenase
MGRTIALATPVFFALIALEWAIGRARGRSNYRLNDAVNSLSLGVISQVVGLFTKLLVVGIYAAVYSVAALWDLPADQWWVWVIAIVAYDFCYYWNHRLGHESAIFWAAHVVHHQSQEYNLSTALRQTSSGALLGWIFYLPMAIAGIPPEVFVVSAVVNLLYQYWIHTEQIGKLGWFDRWFSSPSNHRVHHAVNDRYIDRNYGGIFMVWDRLFGTFVEEDEKCVYGTRAPLDSWDPLWANLEVYADLARRSWRAERWRDKLAVWFMPPGWQPATAGGPAWHKPPFDPARVRRFDPPIGRTARVFVLASFSFVLVGATALLWYASEMSIHALGIVAATILGLLWMIGAVMQGRIRLATAVSIEIAAVLLVAATVAPSARIAAVTPAEQFDERGRQEAQGHHGREHEARQDHDAKTAIELGTGARDQYQRRETEDRRESGHEDGSQS